MNYLVPKFGGVHFLSVEGFVAVNRVLLDIGASFNGSLHEVVVHFDGDVGTCYLTFGHFGIDERLAVGVLDGNGEHQGAAPTILRHLACAVRVAFHEGHEAGGGEGRVLDGGTFGADVREIVSHATTAFHQLNLLLIDSNDGAIAVGVAVHADDKAVGERCNLVVVSDTRHGASLWNDKTEVVDEVEDFLGTHGVGITTFDARYFVGNAPMHVGGGLLVDVAEGVLHGIFVNPNFCSKLVAVEIGQTGLKSLVVGICFLFHVD